MPEDLSLLTNKLLNAAKTAGADAADAIAVDGSHVVVDVSNGALEHVERSEEIDVGLRVLVGQRQACISSSLFDPDTLTTLAGRAVSMAREAPQDPDIGLADPALLAQDLNSETLELFDPTQEPSAETLQEDARRAEAAALDHAGITNVQSSSAGYDVRRIHLSASNGFSGGYKRSNRSISCVAIAGTGTQMERDYFGDSRIFQSDLDSPEMIGKIAAERTLTRIGARKPKTGAFPVIFEERISASLIGHILSATNGMMIARGSSWLLDKLGTQILPKGLSILEDPHRKRISGSKLFDAEGLPTAPRHIVKDGILEGWTLDLATARKLGMNSTASASRGTSAPPSPSAGNIALTQSTQSLDDLIREMGTGLLVTSLIGSTINPNTGDYSRGASGIWIENGEPQYPVNECTIAGNLLQMLKTVRPANDARTHLSRVVPSLLVEGLTIAGT